ncbi:MAG TPA: lipopolysaccharide heptosyltransferase II [Chloroflexota bacterium]|nr:lipopolysaccharide heptosyltransferase II [Chloroflexota bacterium]
MKRLDRALKDEIINIIQAILWVVFGIAGLWGRLAGLKWPYPRFDPDKVRKILVIRLDLLGDVLLSMPAIEALHERYPSAEIWMMTLPYTADIPARYPFVTRVITLDTNSIRSPRRLLSLATLKPWYDTYWLLRRQRFDLAISLFGLMASIWAFLSGATHRIGYLKEAYPLLHTMTLPGMRYDRRQHEVRWCLDLAEFAGAARRDRYTYLEVEPGAAERMDRVLAQHGAGAGTLLIGVHAGSSNGSAKRWPATHWAELADRLYDEFGARIVLTGSPSELPIARQVTSLMRTSPIVLTGQTTVNELAAVLARCDLVLSGDSGPLHLAVALNRPTVSVYGPTDPAISGPYPRPGQIAEVLRTGIGCSPCYDSLSTAECPYTNTVCMHHLTVDRMHQAVRRALRRLDIVPLPVLGEELASSAR